MYQPAIPKLKRIQSLPSITSNLSSSYTDLTTQGQEYHEMQVEQLKKELKKLKNQLIARRSFSKNVLSLVMVWQSKRTEPPITLKTKNTWQPLGGFTMNTTVDMKKSERTATYRMILSGFTSFGNARLKVRIHLKLQNTLLQEEEVTKNEENLVIQLPGEAGQVVYLPKRESQSVVQGVTPPLPAGRYNVSLEVWPKQKLHWSPKFGELSLVFLQ
mmetsp:Transcript_10677/g.15628  ORF Transcript_10677/g.15628 Transcript_10677/m.15628 type:complete len:215 (+) Transcript_10677:84-728(+)